MMEVTIELRVTPGQWAADRLQDPEADVKETEDGRLVVGCAHLVGHTAAVTRAYFEAHTSGDPFTHGCDGCCGGRLANAS